jgi:hypothetical protein
LTFLKFSKVSTWFFQTYIAQIYSGNLPLIAAGIGLLNALLPMGWLNEKCFGSDDEFLNGEPYSKEKWEFLEVFIFTICKVLGL